MAYNPWIVCQIEKPDGSPAPLPAPFYMAVYREASGDPYRSGKRWRRVAFHMPQPTPPYPYRFDKRIVVGEDQDSLPSGYGVVIDNETPLLFRIWRFVGSGIERYVSYVPAHCPELKTDPEHPEQRHVLPMWKEPIESVAADDPFADRKQKAKAALEAMADLPEGNERHEGVWKKVKGAKVHAHLGRSKGIVDPVTKAMAGEASERPGDQAEAALLVALYELAEELDHFDEYAELPLVRDMIKILEGKKISDPLYVAWLLSACLPLVGSPNKENDGQRDTLTRKGLSVEAANAILRSLYKVKQAAIDKRFLEVFEGFFGGACKLDGIDITPQPVMLAVGDGSATLGLLDKLNLGVGLFAYNYDDLAEVTSPAFRTYRDVDGRCITTVHLAAIGLDNGEDKFYDLEWHEETDRSGRSRVVITDYRGEVEGNRSARVTIEAGGTKYEFEVMRWDRSKPIRIRPYPFRSRYDEIRKIQRANENAYVFPDGARYESSRGEFTFPADSKASSFRVRVEGARIGKAGVDEMMVAVCVVRGEPPLDLFASQLFKPDHFDPLPAAQKAVQRAASYLHKWRGWKRGGAKLVLEAIAGGIGREIGGRVYPAGRDYETDLGAAARQRLRCSHLQASGKGATMRLHIASFCDPSPSHLDEITALRADGKPDTMFGLVLRHKDRLPEGQEIRPKGLYVDDELLGYNNNQVLSALRAFALLEAIEKALPAGTAKTQLAAKLPTLKLTCKIYGLEGGQGEPKGISRTIDYARYQKFCADPVHATWRKTGKKRQAQSV